MDGASVQRPFALCWSTPCSPPSCSTLSRNDERQDRLRASEFNLVVIDKFVSDRDCLILVATDAALEGLNLQRANLLVN